MNINTPIFAVDARWMKSNTPIARFARLVPLGAMRRLTALARLCLLPLFFEFSTASHAALPSRICSYMSMVCRMSPRRSLPPVVPT